MQGAHNNWGEPFSPVISEQLTLCPKLGAPQIVLTLAGEDQPVPVELCLAEDVDVVA
jgi:hypothetical protein